MKEQKFSYFRHLIFANSLELDDQISFYYIYIYISSHKLSPPIWDLLSLLLRTFMDRFD